MKPDPNIIPDSSSENIQTMRAARAREKMSQVPVHEVSQHAVTTGIDATVHKRECKSRFELPGLHETRACKSPFT